MKKLFIILGLLISVGVFAQQDTVNIGTSGNAGDGDPLRTAFIKVNSTINDYNRLVLYNLLANEIAILDGGLISTAELNYSVGVTSGIQAQIDLKAPLASPTFTGTVSGITATMVGLSNVTNESKSTMFTSPAFTGTASAFSWTSGSTANANTAYTHSQVGSGNPHSVTTTELSLENVDNTSDANKPVSSATQTALNLKATIADPTFTGEIGIGAVNVSETELGILEGATLSTTELNYVDGVTSAIQTQFTGKVALADSGVYDGGYSTPTDLATKLNVADTVTIEDVAIMKDPDVATKTADYTLVLTDGFDFIYMNLGTADTLFVPTNASVAFPLKTQITIINLQAGATTISPIAGVTLNSVGDVYNIKVNGMVTLLKYSANVWMLTGAVE